MKDKPMFTPHSREDWHSWLERNHAREKVIWVVYFKRAAGQAGIRYEESLEEALCFGWIDSIIQKLDEQRYIRKFNPRRAGSHWSPSNRKRAEKLIREGRMTKAGLAKYDPRAPVSEPDPEIRQILQKSRPIPEEVIDRLRKNDQAFGEFQRLAPSLQRRYAGWVISAKKEETRERRWKELLSVLEQGKTLGLK